MWTDSFTLAAVLGASNQKVKESHMEAIKILFTTPTGLGSLAVIGFIIGMGVYFARMFARKMREDAEAARRGGN